MRSLHQGTRKSGRMVTISGDIQLMPLNFPSKDLTGRDDIVEELAAAFGTPISMLKANDPNLASAQAGYAMWRETTIAPMCRMDEETLNSRLLPMFGIHEDAYLAYDNPVPENRVADSAERSVAVAGGWRTPNEARLEEGYEALETPHADMLHVNGLPLGGVAPVSPFGAPAPMPAYAAPAPAPVEEPAQLPPTAEVEQPAAKALSDVDTTPTDEMATLANRGLKYREEFGRGGTAVGVARARDIGNMVSLSPDTVGRMNSFFARHRVDLDAVGARSGDEGYPSAGAIAWMLWGGDPNSPEGAGVAWAARKAEELASASDVKSKAVDCVGDKISTLIGEGYAQDQAVAIAISMCGGKSFDDAMIEYESGRQEKMASARVKIAAMEAKAWDAVQQQPKIDALQAELDAMKDRTKSLDEIVTMLTEALGDEA